MNLKIKIKKLVNDAVIPASFNILNLEKLMLICFL